MADETVATSMPSCPECKSTNVWRDGIRHTHRNGDVQRYLCRACGKQFSETNWNCPDESEHIQRIHRKILCSLSNLPSNRQVCIAQTKGMKNLVKVEKKTEKTNAGMQQQQPFNAPISASLAELMGKTVDYSFWLHKEGYKESTILARTRLLRRLVKLEANLNDPESIKKTIADQKTWSEGRKEYAVDAYSSFLQMMGKAWEPPRFRRTHKIPFIPTETEIDQLIAALGKKMAVFLQLLKETGMRPGEAVKLKWTDLDHVGNTLRLNEPEKGSNARIFKLSNKLMAMLNDLPRTWLEIFGPFNLDTHRRNYQRQRKRIAYKLKNPRILQISFQTMRHFKGTMEYHRTKDILHVMRVLGHRNIKNTLVYTQLLPEKDDEYVVKVARTIDDAKTLLECGFDYVTDMDSIKLFRKRK